MMAIFIGITLGLGAAVPIGPVNIEIIKRNLAQGMRAGLALGLGACLIDLIYFLLLLYGILYLLTNMAVLAILGILGGCILLFFSYQAFKIEKIDFIERKVKGKHYYQHFRDGLLMTACNPYTILFWSLIGTQFGVLDVSTANKTAWVGFGLIIGILLWVLALNIFIHFSRQKISNTAQYYINRAGGWLLFFFAFIGLYKSCQLLWQLLV